MISPSGDTILIDFSGRCTLKYIEIELQETKEGDLQGLKKLRSRLLSWWVARRIHRNTPSSSYQLACLVKSTIYVSCTPSLLHDLFIWLSIHFLSSGYNIIAKKILTRIIFVLLSTVACLKIYDCTKREPELISTATSETMRDWQQKQQRKHD